MYKLIMEHREEKIKAIKEMMAKYLIDIDDLKEDYDD